MQRLSAVGSRLSATTHGGEPSRLTARAAATLAAACALLACDAKPPDGRPRAPNETAAPRSTPLASDSQPAARSNGSSSDDPFANPPAVLALVDPKIRDDSATTISKTDLVQCYELPRYFVVEKQSRDEPGSDVFVRPKSGSLLENTGGSLRCVTDSLPGDYVIRNEWAEYYAGMRGDWLFLDSGTGPSRTLILHDVAARRKVVDIGGAEGVGWRDSLTYVLWIERGEQPPERCPAIPAGLGSGLDSLYALDVRTSALSALGHARCAPRQ